MSYVAAVSQRNIIYSKSRTRALICIKNNKLVVYLLISLIILFSILYIVQANSVATGGYRIEKYKDGLKNLQSENKNLGLKLSEVQSPGYLEGKVESLKMVKVGNVEYLMPTPEVAAK